MSESCLPHHSAAGQGLPKVTLTSELPELLSRDKAVSSGSAVDQKGSSVKYPRFLYAFEIVTQSSDGRGHEAVTHRFGLLTEKALPVDDLPAFRVTVSSYGSDPSAPLSNNIAEIIPPSGWGWGRLRQPANGPSGAITPVLLSEAEIKCLDACQLCYSALVDDAARPSLTPWSNDRTADERLSEWRSMMGLVALEDALRGLGDDEEQQPYDRQTPSERSQPFHQSHLWLTVPLTGTPQGDTAIGGGAIDWESIRAMATGGTPLFSLPDWPIQIGGSSRSETSETQAIVTSFSRLEGHLMDHGIVIAMHSGKMHVARGLQSDMNPGSPFPGLHISFAEYFHRLVLRYNWLYSKVLDVLAQRPVFLLFIFTPHS